MWEHLDNGTPAILGILLRDETLALDVDVKALARETEGFSGSDLKRMSRMFFYNVPF